MLPAEGVDINKKCPVQVNVEYLDDSAKSMQKVTFSLYANYNDTPNNLSHYVDGFEKGRRCHGGNDHVSASRIPGGRQRGLFL